MSHPYDASTKYLVENRLADWLPLCGQTTSARAEVIDADLATVTAAADKVLRLDEDPPWLFHLELQSSRDPALPVNLGTYNILLDRRHRLLVRTAVVLLRRAADGPELTGRLERGFRGESPYLAFRYAVVRLWEMPVETFLDGGLGLLPLAPLGAVAEAELPGVIWRMDQRISQEANPEEAGALWTAADVLMGLRYRREFVEQLLRGVRRMKESVTYQAIVEEGVVRGLQDLLLEVGNERFGSAGQEVERAVRAIADVDRLKRLNRRVHAAGSWQDLLAVE